MTLKDKKVQVLDGEGVLNPLFEEIFSEHAQRLVDLFSTKWYVNQPNFGRYDRPQCCKDLVYRHIHDTMQKHGISGSYFGLAGSRIPQICSLLYPHIKDTFLTCESDPKASLVKKLDTLEDLRQYISLLKKNCQFPLDFEVVGSDIYRATTRATVDRQKPYAFIDLDYMVPLGNQVSVRSARISHDVAAERSVMAVWHCLDRRKNKGNKVLKKERSVLRRNITRFFKVLDYSPMQYRAGHGWPMRVDIYTLERKNTCKKGSSKAA